MAAGLTACQDANDGENVVPNPSQADVSAELSKTYRLELDPETTVVFSLPGVKAGAFRKADVLIPDMQVLFNGFPGQPGFTIIGAAQTWLFFPNPVDEVEYGEPIPLPDAPSPEVSARFGASFLTESIRPHISEDLAARSKAMEVRITQGESEALVFTLMGPIPEGLEPREFAEKFLATLAVERGP